MTIPDPGHRQFTMEELSVILDALIFTLNCLHGDREDVELYSGVKVVLAKVESLLKQVENTA